MRRSWLWTPLLLIGLAVGSYATYLYLSPAPLPDGLIYGNGHIEGTEVRVSAEVSGRVLDSTLVEGTAVAAGDLLVVLDDADPQIRLREVRAERNAIGKERERVAQQLVTWKHHLVTAEKDLERSRKLERRGTSRNGAWKPPRTRPKRRRAGWLPCRRSWPRPRPGRAPRRSASTFLNSSSRRRVSTLPSLA